MSKYPFSTMQPGDDVFYSKAEYVPALRVTLSVQGKRRNLRFTTKPDTRDGIEGRLITCVGPRNQEAAE